MSTIIAALDNSAAARPVLDTAVALAELLNTRVEAVHVREDTARTASEAAAAARVPLRLLEGSPIEAILGVIAEPDVEGAVLGARAHPAGRRPIGGTALQLVVASNKPVVVVPPEAATGRAHGVRRVLLPLEGEEDSAREAEEALQVCLRLGVDLVVLHVIDAERTPRFLDRPERDMTMWADEFLARWCPAPGRLTMRRGRPGEKIIDLAGSEEVDLVVLSWARDVSVGRAAVVQEVLARSTVPVLLLSPAARNARILTGIG